MRFSLQRGYVSSNCPSIVAFFRVPVINLRQFQSPMVNDRSKPFGANFITYFYSEARRQWDIEARHSSLPRLQAAMVLFMVLGKLGRDTDGYHFLEEACRMARELGLAGSEYPATPCPVNVREADWSRVRAVTAWSLFNFQM